MSYFATLYKSETAALEAAEEYMERRDWTWSVAFKKIDEDWLVDQSKKRHTPGREIWCVEVVGAGEFARSYYEDYKGEARTRARFAWEE